MNKHKTLGSFVLVNWYWWLLFTIAVGFGVRWYYPGTDFWQVFWWGISYRIFSRLFDAVDELWDRVQLLREKDEGES